MVCFGLYAFFSESERDKIGYQIAGFAIHAAYRAQFMLEFC